MSTLKVRDSLGQMMRRGEIFEEIEKFLRELGEQRNQDSGQSFGADHEIDGILVHIKAQLNLLHSKLNGESQVVG